MELPAVTELPRAARSSCENPILFPLGEERLSPHCSAALKPFRCRCSKGLKEHIGGHTKSIVAFQGRTELQPGPRAFLQSKQPLMNATNKGFSGNTPSHLSVIGHIPLLARAPFSVPPKSPRPQISRPLLAPLHGFSLNACSMNLQVALRLPTKHSLRTNISACMEHRCQPCLCKEHRVQHMASKLRAACRVAALTILPSALWCTLPCATRAKHAQLRQLSAGSQGKTH